MLRFSTSARTMAFLTLLCPNKPSRASGTLLRWFGRVPNLSVAPLMTAARALPTLKCGIQFATIILQVGLGASLLHRNANFVCEVTTLGNIAAMWVGRSGTKQSIGTPKRGAIFRSDVL